LHFPGSELLAKFARSSELADSLLSTLCRIWVFQPSDVLSTDYTTFRLVCGAAAVLIGRFTGLNTNVTTLMMVAFALQALLVGFFKKQELGFIDYVRKYYLVRKYKDMVWVSTEDPGVEEVCGCRRVIPLQRKQVESKASDER